MFESGGEREGEWGSAYPPGLDWLLLLALVSSIHVRKSHCLSRQQSVHKRREVSMIERERVVILSLAKGLHISSVS